MYWSDRLVLVTPGMPHLTVLSMQPQQGPPNQLTITEFWSLIYWALCFFPRVKNTVDIPVSRQNDGIPFSKHEADKSGAQVRLISICDMQARIVSARFSREYLRFVGLRLFPRDGHRVCGDVAVEDYQDLSGKDKERFLYLTHRISEVAVNDGSVLSTSKTL